MRGPGAGIRSGGVPEDARSVRACPPVAWRAALRNRSLDAPAAGARHVWRLFRSAAITPRDDTQDRTAAAGAGRDPTPMPAFIGRPRQRPHPPCGAARTAHVVLAAAVLSWVSSRGVMAARLRIRWSSRVR